MTQRTSSPVNTPCWNDLQTSDLPGAIAFYSGVLGWEAQEPEEQFGGYTQMHFQGEPVAGLAPRMMQGAPDAWTFYVHVADPDATLARATAAGANVLAPAMQVGDLGTMGVAMDPAGGVFGIWRPGTFQGLGRIDEPGAPRWFELMSKDYQGSLDFYRRVFDWDITTHSDTDEFRYATPEHDGNQFAGIMDASGFLPAAVPSFWSIYFGVTDVDAAVRMAAELGGTVTQEPNDTPYGRLATVSDPTGAMFNLMA
jgi:predicted enzyme related to lactoylglutathione lyase